MSVRRMRYEGRKKLGGRAQVLVFGNHKGGAGKTTGAATWGALQVHLHGKRVLFVDLDGQANLTSHLGFLDEFDYGRDIETVLWSKKDWSPNRILDSVCSIKVEGIALRMDLIPGYRLLEDVMAALERRQQNDPNVQYRLMEALEMVREYYDYIIIDTPPSLSGMTVDLSLNSADTVLIPINGFDAITGMINFIDRIENFQKFSRREKDIQVLLFSPHCQKVAKVAPYGAAGVQNDTWYPLLYDTFPHHFIPAVVRHTSKLQHGHASQPGMMWKGLTGGIKSDYRVLEAGIRNALSDGNTPLLYQWMQGSEYDADAFCQQVAMAKQKLQRKLDAKAVRYK